MVVKNITRINLAGIFLILFSLVLLPVSHLFDIYVLSWIFIAILSCAFIVTYMSNPALSNWMLWFQAMCFIMFGLSVLFYCFGVYDENDIFYIDTTFVAQLSIDSFKFSMGLIALAVSFLSVLYQLDFSGRQIKFPSYNKRIETAGMLLTILTLPQCILVAYFNFDLSSLIGYTALYSADVRNYSNPVPFASIWTNANHLGFMIFYASVPKERNFLTISALFLILRFIESLGGARGLFIIPLFSIVWLWASMYQKQQIRFSLVFLGALGLWIFSTLITLFRDGFGFDYFFNAIRAFSSISKGLEMVAIYIEYADLVDHRGVFFIEPLLFPISYFQTLGAVVGQSDISAALRNELGHSLASELNYSAYAAGAGLGSSFVAEAYQYGIFLFFAILTCFYIFYRTIFRNLKNRFILAFILPLFQQFVFTPRDTSLPNSFLFIKYGLFIALVLWFFSKHEPRSGNPVIRDSNRLTNFPKRSNL